MLLAIDTATRLLSIALADEHRTYAEWSWYSANHHTVELAPHVEQLMHQSQVSPADLTALAVVTGPGSFTGLRIGMSYAKGLALARSVPLVGIPTLEVVAAGQPILGPRLCAVVPAGRGRITPAFFVAKEQYWVQTSNPKITTWEELIESIAEPTQFAGEIDNAGRTILASKPDYVILSAASFHLRRAGFLAQLAYEAMSAEGGVQSAATLAPTYLT